MKKFFENLVCAAFAVLLIVGIAGSQALGREGAQPVKQGVVVLDSLASITGASTTNTSASGYVRGYTNEFKVIGTGRDSSTVIDNRNGIMYNVQWVLTKIGSTSASGSSCVGLAIWGSNFPVSKTNPAKSPLWKYIVTVDSNNAAGSATATNRITAATVDTMLRRYPYLRITLAGGGASTDTLKATVVPYMIYPPTQYR